MFPCSILDLYAITNCGNLTESYTGKHRSMDETSCPTAPRDGSHIDEPLIYTSSLRGVFLDKPTTVN